MLCLCFYQFEVSDMLLWIAVRCFVYLYHFSCWIFKGWGQPVLFIPFFSLYLLQVELCPEQLLHDGCSNVLALLLPNITMSLGAPFSFHLIQGLCDSLFMERTPPNSSCGMVRPLWFPFGSVNEWLGETQTSQTWHCKAGLGQHCICSKLLTLIAPSRGAFLFFISISKTYHIGSAAHSQ